MLLLLRILFHCSVDAVASNVILFHCSVDAAAPASAAGRVGDDHPIAGVPAQPTLESEGTAFLFSVFYISTRFLVSNLL
jgi:hypothetical protein